MLSISKLSYGFYRYEATIFHDESVAFKMKEDALWRSRQFWMTGWHADDCRHIAHDGAALERLTITCEEANAAPLLMKVMSIELDRNISIKRHHLWL